MENINGKKGGASKPYIPVEDENSLRSNSIARIVDVISEGEIEGFVTDNPNVDVLIDKIELGDFSGITTTLKEGLPEQTHVPGFSAESEQAVGIKLTYNVATTKTITNTNVDECIVTVRVPALLEQKDNGDIKKTSVKFRIEINSTTVGDKTIHGKCISEYLKSYRLPLLENFGSGPWEIKLTRLTADSSSPKLANNLYWNTYTELINEKIPYNDTALVAFTANAQQFGGKLPQRLYHVKGIKVRYPSNYHPTTRIYSGSWDGSFTIGYTNNPAWIYYDLLYSERYGCGFEKDIGDGNYFIDKWELYTIAQNCDVLVDDGKGGTEPRFTFNSVINTREQAQVVLTSLASTFRAKPFWFTGLATLSQDRPRDPVKVVSNADVIDGLFQYSGSSLKDRVTCVNVSWNDPDDFYKTAVEVVEDQSGMVRYGFNTADVAAYGCTSRAQARRFGKWYLYTELQQTTTVEYSASFDHFQLIPGDVIIVNDDHYITKKLGGRIKSATTTQIVIDRNVILESGKTYTIAMEGPKGQLVRADILNSPETTDTLSISTITYDNVPQAWSVFSINSDSFDERQFQIVNMQFKEDNIVNIKALLYDANKFDAVDSGIYFDEKHYSDISEGALLPPTNLSAEEYSYTDGQNNLFGLLLNWEHPDDARINRYEIQSKTEAGSWKNEGVTEQNSYTIKPVEAGNYYFRVRSVSISSFSTWATTSLFTVYADPDQLSTVTNLKTVNGDGGATDEFDGKNCEIVWGYDIEDRFKEYFIEVYNNTTLKRTAITTDKRFIYTYDMNLEDNSPVTRNINFKVYTRDVYDKLSTSADIQCTNPIPSMASVMPTTTNLFKGLKITWSSVSDNDMESYKIYLDKSNPPTTEIVEVGANTNSWIEVELDSDDTYYVQIEPYDYFGVGTKSQVANGEPLLLPGDGIDIELTSTIEITDSAGRTSTQLSILYDGDKISNSLTYNPSNWIEYKFPVEYIIDNMTVWATNNAGKIYVGYKRGEADSWHYLKAESDHTLDSDGRLLSASSESDANDNYLDLSVNINRALFPQALVATHCRLFFSSHQTISTNIYELRFIREVIAEQIIADNLSSISANIGAIEAGTIQSQNYDNTHGMLLDLNGDVLKCGGNTDPKLHWDGPANELNIKAKVTFESNSTGYNNITDKPSNLSGINSTEGNKLSGIEDGADVTSENLIISNNLLRTPVFRSADYKSWTKHGTATFTWRTGDMWCLPNVGTGDIHQEAPGGGSVTIESEQIPVIEGEIYCASVYTSIHRCLTYVDVLVYDKNNVLVLDSGQPANAQNNGVTGTNGQELNQYTRIYNFVTMPANSAYAIFRLVKHDTDTGYSNSYAFFQYFQFEKAALNQTTPSPWVGSSIEIDDGADVTGDNTANNTNNVGAVEAARVAGWGHTTDTTKIDGGKIFTGSIVADSLDVGAVTADKIDAEAVTADKIDAEAVTADKIDADAVTADKIDAGAVTANAVGTNEIIANSANIKDGVIKNVKIKDATIQTAKIGNYQITKAWSGYTAMSSVSSTNHNWTTSVSLTISPSYDGASDFLVFGNALVGSNIDYEEYDDVYLQITGPSSISSSPVRTNNVKNDDDYVLHAISLNYIISRTTDASFTLNLQWKNVYRFYQRAENNSLIVFQRIK